MQELNLNSKDIASFVVKFCAVQNYFINLTKLQKLIFCCYGVALAEGNIRICKEHPKAWDHGPVFPQVYKLTSKNRDGFVQHLLEQPNNYINVIPPSTLEIMNKALIVFGRYNAGELVAWTHRKDSPWDICVKKYGLYKAMDDDVIRDYFLKNVLIQDKANA